MTAGRLYVFDYLTDGTAANQELDGKTIGTDYFYIPIEVLNGQIDQEYDLTYYPGGHGYHFRYDQDSETITVGSEHMTKAEQGYVRQYWKKQRDDDNDAEYMFFYRGTGDVYPFYDEDGTAKEYARGILSKIPLHAWSKENPLLFEIRIEFKVVWT